jgi:hypothetical protein
MSSTIDARKNAGKDSKNTTELQTPAPGEDTPGEVSFLLKFAYNVPFHDRTSPSEEIHA